MTKAPVVPNTPEDAGPTKPGVKLNPESREVARLRNGQRVATVLALATLAGLVATNRNELIGGAVQMGIPSHLAAYQAKAVKDAQVRDVQEDSLEGNRMEQAAVAQFEADRADGTFTYNSNFDSYPKSSDVHARLMRAREARDDISADEKTSRSNIPACIDGMKADVLAARDRRLGAVEDWKVAVNTAGYRGAAFWTALTANLTEEERQAMLNGNNGYYDFTSEPWASNLLMGEDKWANAVTGEGGSLRTMGEVVSFEELRSPTEIREELIRLQRSLGTTEAALKEMQKGLEAAAETARDQIREKAQADLAAVPSKSALAQQIRDGAESRLQDIDKRLVAGMAGLEEALIKGEQLTNGLASEDLRENEKELQKNLGWTGEVVDYFVGGWKPVMDSAVRDCHREDMQFEDPAYCTAHARELLDCTGPKRAGTVVIETVCDDGLPKSMRAYACADSVELQSGNRRTRTDLVAGHSVKLSTGDLCERVESWAWSTEAGAH